MIRTGQRRQRTLAESAVLSGVGLITGAKVCLRLRPAPVNAGLAFIRTDLPNSPIIPALSTNVGDTRRRTTLGVGTNQVTLVEHVLAALAGMRIDNALIEIDGPEPPGLDGSAADFVELINRAGIAIQGGVRTQWTVRRPITFEQDGAAISFFPAANNELKISYFLDYGAFAPITPQTHTERITPDSFQYELSRCRTFLLEMEAQELRKQGVGKHLQASELLVFGAGGLISNRLRFSDEPSRHKILDLVGDLALSGIDLVGHVVAYRSGHSLNVKLATALHSQIGESFPTVTSCSSAA